MLFEKQVSRKPKPIDAELFREYLSYEPETGKFLWKKDSYKHRRVGTEAGSYNKQGYLTVGINGGKYYAHRVAFAMMGLEVPDLVDHIDGDKSNCRWSNLRPASFKNNIRNAMGHKDAIVQCKGVSLTVEGRYRTRAYRDGKTHYLGVYETQTDAEIAYSNFCKTYDKDFYKGDPNGFVRQAGFS